MSNYNESEGSEINKIEGNIRDNTDLLHLVILNNLESINYELIKINLSQEERLIKLNNSVRRQIEIIKDNVMLRI